MTCRLRHVSCNGSHSARSRKLQKPSMKWLSAASQNRMSMVKCLFRRQNGTPRHSCEGCHTTSHYNSSKNESPALFRSRIGRTPFFFYSHRTLHVHAANIYTSSPACLLKPRSQGLRIRTVCCDHPYTSAPRLGSQSGLQQLLSAPKAEPAGQPGPQSYVVTRVSARASLSTAPRTPDLTGLRSLVHGPEDADLAGRASP